MNDIIVIRPMIGLTAMLLCAVKGKTDEELLEAANLLNECGTEKGWTTVHREGDYKPVQCTEHDDREHIIITC